ncbi:hypothetical protein LZ30DRAFT_690879 [Colletotrichum cereale]|nr:hypothetical protein LZ30DRAFT_690879 [Colletotrichum cereale]
MAAVWAPSADVANRKKASESDDASALGKTLVTNPFGSIYSSIRSWTNPSNIAPQPTVPLCQFQLDQHLRSWPQYDSNTPKVGVYALLPPGYRQRPSTRTQTRQAAPTAPKMRQTTFITGLAAMLPSAAQAWSLPVLLGSRQDSRPYQDAVCKPATSSGSQVPPCVEIENIEVACKPNGTEPIHLEAHAQCMCGGSFFAEKLACERCLFVHGLRSEQNLAYYRGILSSASNALCTGTPTAEFSAVYSNIAAAATPVTTGATAKSDQAPSNTAISLYYTASGAQGPGSITGEAVSATGTSNEITAGPTTTPTGSAMSRGPSTRASTTAATAGTATDDAATTTFASGNGAVPTYAAGGLMMGAAGLAMFVGL